MTEPTPTYYWHVHHDVLCEALNEPLDNRIGYIQAHKPTSEIETRLRLLRPCGPGVALAWAEYMRVKDAAQAECNRVMDAAGADYDRTLAHYERTRDPKWPEFERVMDAARVNYVRARDAAGIEYDRICCAAMADYDREVERIHGLECIHGLEYPDCPWNGRTIFP